MENNDFKINDIVNIKGTRLIGKIIRYTNNKDRYIININGKNIDVLSKDMQKFDKNTNINRTIYIQEKNNNNISIDIKKDDNFKNEIMLRHQTVEIALYNLDKFIDEAIINNVAEVKIIHGKHGGILRQAVHDYLKNNKNILDFHLGNYFEGQYGVTIARLK